MSDNAKLRERVAWALFKASPLRWERYRVASLAQLPQQEGQTLLLEADAALRALGLDDLDAAVERGALTLFEDHYGEKHGSAYMPIRDSRWWSYAEDSLKAALAPPEADPT